MPAEWLKDVREADEDGLLALAGHLPAEAAEAVLELATGGTPQVAKPNRQLRASRSTHSPIPTHSAASASSPASRNWSARWTRPWDKWAVFLHPEQRQLVTRDYSGPARVAGSAGTGKTVVALHRAVHLARATPDGRILLATFSEPLAHALRANVKRLIGNEPRVLERLEVHSMSALGLRLHQAQLGPVRLASSDDVDALLREASTNGRRSQVLRRISANRVESSCRCVAAGHLGGISRRPASWPSNAPSRSEACSAVDDLRARASRLEEPRPHDRGGCVPGARGCSGQPAPAFDAAVVDEAQDISIAQLRFLAALGGSRPNALFFSGDLGQRIFQQPFSWKALGVDVRGRSKTLRVNYRTSHQIREQADRLLGPEITDVDGNREDRRHTVSVFNGPPPEIRTFPGGEESGAVGAWLRF